MTIELTPFQMRDIVIDALKVYDANLGTKAEELFDRGFDEAVTKNEIQDDNEIIRTSESSWQLREAAIPRVQRSIPAHAEAELFTDENGGSHLLYSKNPNSHPVIQYEYNRSLDSLIYLGHEVGHALADTLTREAGRDPKEWPSENGEIQAYYVQNILYDYLEKNNPELKEAVLEHKREITKDIDKLKTSFQLSAEIIRPRAIDFEIASNLFDAATNNPNLKDTILETIMGVRGGKTLDQIFETIQTGKIESARQLQL
jgi:hypothetical protein